MNSIKLQKEHVFHVSLFVNEKQWTAISCLFRILPMTLLSFMHLCAFRSELFLRFFILSDLLMSRLSQSWYENITGFLTLLVTNIVSRNAKTLIYLWFSSSDRVRATDG